MKRVRHLDTNAYEGGALDKNTRKCWTRGEQGFAPRLCIKVSPWSMLSVKCHHRTGA